VQVANKFRPPKKKIDLILSPAQLTGEEPLPFLLFPSTEKPEGKTLTQFGAIADALDKKPKPQAFENPNYKLGAFKAQLKPITHYSGSAPEDVKVGGDLFSVVADESPKLNYQTLETAWADLAEYIKAKGKISLANSMRRLPEQKALNLWEFRFENSSQLEDATPEKQEMVEFLRRKMGNPSLNFNFSVSQLEDRELKLLGPKEKYQKMVALNPLLKLLRDKLDLDLEY
jgi:hypothetical protein